MVGWNSSVGIATRYGLDGPESNPGGGSGMQAAPCVLDSYPHRITSTKRRINTVVSPDDGHIIARNM